MIYVDANEILADPSLFTEEAIAEVTAKLQAVTDAAAVENNEEAVQTALGELAAYLAAIDPEALFIVTFVVDGETVKTETVQAGGSATLPAQAEYVYNGSNHKKFSGWEGEFTDVHANVTVTGSYTQEGHVWTDSTVTLAPTCMAGGTQLQTCVCGVTQTKELPVNPNNHTRKNTTTLTENEVEATCTAVGGYDEIVKCECGEQIRFTHITVPKKAHTPGEPTRANESAATCIRPATYTEDVKCSVCGELLGSTPKTEGSALGHDWSDWSTEKEATCTRAGSETRSCSRCGAAESRVISVKSHIDADGNTVCDICGATLANHTHTDENFDNICDTCGKAIDTGDRCAMCNDNARIQAGSEPKIIKLIVQFIHYIVHGVQSIRTFSFK